MKKTKRIYMTTLAMLLSFSPVVAQELSSTTIVDEVKVLKLEDAVLQAQKRSRLLKIQQQNIDYAKVDREDAYYTYNNASDYVFEIASTNYSQKQINEEYEKKLEPILEEQIAWDVSNQFDSILELEAKYDLGQKKLHIQEQKTRHAIKKQQLGLESKSGTETQKMLLEAQKKDMESITQSIDAAYRKLNDTIGGKEAKYHLVKENIYTPFEMKRSIQGHISYSITSDPSFWKQEESAKLQKNILAVNTENGAPTWAEYQKRKISYELGMSSVAQTKEHKEQLLKSRYEQIFELELLYEKTQLQLQEAKRQYEIAKIQYELDMITSLTLEEAQFNVMQVSNQVDNIVRQHNQVKTLFEKTYLESTRM